jgi:uncharacterized membrane protein (DUF485 family)
MRGLFFTWSLEPMFHEPASQSGDDPSSGYKASLGMKLFVAYGLVYAGFVAINLIKPTLMETIIFFGLNLAVVYGMGLILLALIMALIYNRMCGKHEAASHKA